MALILFSASMSLAVEPDAQTKLNNKLAICTSISTFAESVMNNRQNGVAIKSVIDAISDEDQTVKAIGVEVAMNAYDVPRFYSEKNIVRSIEDFRDMYYLQCLQSFKD
jgi:hypothetical protein